MADLRLVLSDVDGTLVRSDKTLSDTVVAAVGRLQAAGVPVSLISARPPSGMLWIAEKLRLTGPIAAFNGGTLVDPSGTVLSAHRLPPDVARRALALIDRPGIARWLFCGGQWYADRPSGDHDGRERKSANVDPIYDADFADLLDAVDKIVAVSDDPDLLGETERLAMQSLSQDAAVGRSQTYYLDITAPAANKGDGVAAVAAAMGAPLDDVAVIGDQRNDLPMFARAGLSIAMGQGPAEVRAAAMKITRSNDEDGVAHAIDDILLPLAARLRN